MDGLAAELEVLSQDEVQGPLLATELICKAAEEALESQDEEHCGSDQGTLPEELLECLLDSFGAWVPLGDEEPSPQLLLLGAIILDVCPLLMKMGHSGSRAAGLMLPALLRAAAQVANPREMLAALMEALDVHARNCFHGPQYLLMLSLLPLLPSLLTKLSRRKLACTLEALGPVEALAAEAGQHLWQSGHPLQVKIAWLHSSSSAGQVENPQQQSYSPGHAVGARLEPKRGDQAQGALNEGVGGALGQQAANVTEKVVVQPFVAMLEGVWRSVLLPEVQQCCMSASSGGTVGAAGAIREAASAQASSTPAGQAAHACRVFATSCLRAMWLLSGSMPPSPIHPSSSMLAANRGDGSKGSSTPSQDWSWPGGGVWEGPLGRLAQLALAAVQAAAAVDTGEMSPAAGGPVSGLGVKLAGDWKAHLVGWEQVLSAVHAVHPEADTRQLERVKAGSMGKSGSKMGACGEDISEVKGERDARDGHGGGSDSCEADEAAEEEGGSDSCGGNEAAEEEGRMLESRAQSQQALAGAGLAVLLSQLHHSQHGKHQGCQQRDGQRHLYHHNHQQHQQPFPQTQQQGLLKWEGMKVLVPPPCPMKRIEMLASTSAPILASCCKLMSAALSPLASPSFGLELSVKLSHAFTLLSLGSAAPPPCSSSKDAADAAAAAADRAAVTAASAAPPPAATAASAAGRNAQYHAPVMLQSLQEQEQQQPQGQPLHHQGCTLEKQAQKSLGNMLANMAEKWDFCLTEPERRAVDAMRFPLGMACNCLVGPLEEGLRSSGFRALQIVLDTLPTAPRCALLQKLLQPYTSAPSFLQAPTDSQHSASPQHPQTPAPNVIVTAVEGTHSGVPNDVPIEVATLLVQQLRKDVAASAAARSPAAVEAARGAAVALPASLAARAPDHSAAQTGNTKRVVNSVDPALDLLSSPWPFCFACQILLGCVHNAGGATGGSGSMARCAYIAQQQQEQQQQQQEQQQQGPGSKTNHAHSAHQQQRQQKHTDPAGASHQQAADDADDVQQGKDMEMQTEGFVQENPQQQQQQQQQQLLQPPLPPRLLCLQAPVSAHADLTAAALSLVRLIALRLRARAQQSMHSTPRELPQGAAPVSVSTAAPIAGSVAPAAVSSGTEAPTAAAPALAQAAKPASALEQGLQAKHALDPQYRAAADGQSTQSMDDVVRKADQQSVQVLLLLSREVLLPLSDWLELRQQQVEGEAMQATQVDTNTEQDASETAASSAGGMAAASLHNTAPSHAAPSNAAPALPESVAEFTALGRLHEVVEAVKLMDTMSAGEDLVTGRSAGQSG